MLSIQMQKDLFNANPLNQEELVLMSEGNRPIKSFETREEAKAWLEERNKKPGVHPTVRLVKKITQFEELGYV
ncbi:hypothetical protein [Paraburkholderia sp. SIMBA_054]|uniref:hypothetical protein n=1 Tax=Paraburkholderia sp. SIMBA_054 TaxID=3085795 RepID=UPI003979A442